VMMFRSVRRDRDRYRGVGCLRDRCFATCPRRRIASYALRTSLPSPRFKESPRYHPGETWSWVKTVRLKAAMLRGVEKIEGGASMGPRRYRITVRGRLSERFASAFDGMTIEPGAGKTVLVGDIVDQAQLYGVLDLLRNLGLDLMSVEEGAA
jgi:hypothetical protein